MSATLGVPGVFCGKWNGARQKEAWNRLGKVPQMQLAPREAYVRAHREIMGRIEQIEDPVLRQAERRQAAKPHKLGMVLGVLMTAATLKKENGKKDGPIFELELSVREIGLLTGMCTASVAWCFRWLRDAHVYSGGQAIGHGIGWVCSEMRGGIACVGGVLRGVRRTSVRWLSAKGFQSLGLAKRFTASAESPRLQA